MQALGFNEHGDITKMQFFDTAVPKPNNQAVLIKVHASAFNHLDIWVRIGWPGLKLAMPHIAGSDAAGEIVEVGKSVYDFKVGDRVAVNPGINLLQDEYTLRGEHSISPSFKILGEQIPGTHAEYLAMPAVNCIKVPENIDYVTAASAGLVALTAWRMLVYRAKLRASETVLVVGAGGGLNSIAIQIAKLCGCRVIALTSSKEKIALAQKIGADLTIDYKEHPDWPELIYKMNNKKGVEVVVDNVGLATMQKSMRIVKPGGRIVIVGNTSGAITPIDLRYLFAKQISLIGSTMGSPQDYYEVMRLVFAKKIMPIIDKIFPFSEGIPAMQLLESGEQFGKIVLEQK